MYTHTYLFRVSFLSVCVPGALECYSVERHDCVCMCICVCLCVCDSVWEFVFLYRATLRWCTVRISQSVWCLFVCLCSVCQLRSGAPIRWVCLFSFRPLRSVGGHVCPSVCSSVWWCVCSALRTACHTFSTSFHTREIEYLCQNRTSSTKFLFLSDWHFEVFYCR